VPALSAFTPLGLLELSSADSLGRVIYDAIWASLGDNFARGGYTDAKVYAWSLQLARVQKGARHVEEQIDPFKILDLLPAREFEFGLVANATMTIADRRAQLAAAMAFGSVGGTYGNIRQALTNLLGADFVDYQIQDKTAATVIPSNPALGPGHFAPQSTPRYGFTVTTPYAGPYGGNVQLNMIAWDVTQPYTRAGDVVVIEPENPDLAERVTVVDWIGGSTNAIIIVSPMTKPKDAGCSLISQPWPYWTSNMRHSRIVVSAAAGSDPVKRNAIHVLMNRMARATSTWCVVSSLGPFVLATSFALNDGSTLDTTCILTT